MGQPTGESPPDTRRRSTDLATGLLFLAAVVLWGVNVASERFIGDDAYISFRYADNLVRGLGLVWNPGERVEGYTNFLWVLLTAGGMRLGFAPELFSQVLSIGAGLAVLVGCVLAGGTGPGGRLRGAFLALCVAAHGSFGAWSTSGLETMGFTALVWWGTWRFLHERERDPRRHVGSALLFALAALTRPEGLLFAGVAGLFALVETARGRASVRALASYALPLVLPVAAHFLWRRAYYGTWLPNTFHAKVPGVWIEQGLAYLGLYELHYHALAFLPLALLAFVGRRRREAALVSTALGLYLLYVLQVGGDRFEFRFLVPVVPHYAWLVVEGVWVLAARGGGARRAPVLVAGAAALAFLVVTWRGFTPRDVERHGVSQIAGVRGYADRRVQEGKFLRALIDEGVLPRDVVLCVGGAGAVPYFTRWTTVDRRGLNDAYIAGLPVEKRSVLAHERDAPHEYLVERGVAVFDYLNRLVIPWEVLLGASAQKEHDGHPLALRAIRFPERGDQALVFATFVSDEELARLFPGLRILSPADF